MVSDAQSSRTTGDVVPMAPLQEWFFSRHPAQPSYFNQSMAFRVQAPLTFELAEEFVNQTIAAHDAFGLRFERVGPDAWRQVTCHPARVAIQQVDLSEVHPGRRPEAVEEASERLHRSLDITCGRTVAAALIDRGAREHPLLVLVAHHLVIDGVSWRILLEDLDVSFRAALDGGPAETERTATFREWCNVLNGQLSGWSDEAPFWATRVPESARWSVADEVGLDRGEIQRLTFNGEVVDRLQMAGRGGELGIDHMLLAALSEAVSTSLGSRDVLIDVENHGRDAILELDVSRTVGWLAAVWPLCVRPGGRHTRELAESIAATAKAAAGDGLRYSALRFVARASAVTGLPEPRVIFAYLGHYGEGSTGSLLSRAPVATGWGRSRFGTPAHTLIVNAWGEGERLEVNWIIANSSPLAPALSQAADAFRSAVESLAASLWPPTGTRPPAARVVPGSETERVVHTAWANVLGRESTALGVEDDFFALGGDSTHMIQIASRIRRHFGVRVPLRAIFEHTTIRSLADTIDSALAVGSDRVA